MSFNKQLADSTSRFEIADVAANAKGSWKWGRLEYTGTPKNGSRYLKFRDGPYWLKAGCDDPENFLGRYQNYNTLSKRKASIDYLASKGINSLYIMTHNVDGDDKDVWPWLGKNLREARQNGGKDARFDVAKLEQWRVLFEHMQTKGVVTYLVLEDDSAWKGYDHGRYYREMIARLGYLPALIFNFNEEHNENYRLAEALQYMGQLGRIDPYDHPRGIHNVNSPATSMSMPRKSTSRPFKRAVPAAAADCIARYSTTASPSIGSILSRHVTDGKTNADRCIYVDGASLCRSIVAMGSGARLASCREPRSMNWSTRAHDTLGKRNFRPRRWTASVAKCS